MPQHNPTRYMKENSHFPQILAIEEIPDGFRLCEICDKWTFDYYSHLYELHSWDQDEEDQQQNYKFRFIGSLLLDYQSICNVPHFPSFKFDSNRPAVFPPNFTVQYLIVMNNDDEELLMIPMTKNGYWIESKDLIRLETEFFYDEDDELSSILCQVNREMCWKIALETIGKHSIVMDETFANIGVPITKYCFTNEESAFTTEGGDSLIYTMFPITERLILCCSYPKEAKSETFQGLMINEMKWHLYDSKDGSTLNQIYPVVYPLANDNEPLDLSFKLKRNWKNFNNSITKIDSCISGDLNGGYSDKIIYQLGKKDNTISEDDIINYAPSAIAISDLQQIGEPIITSFRPFHSNPDLFQVQLLLSNFVKEVVKDANIKMGFMFSFQFKIIEEFTLTKEKLFEKLIRNHLTDCKFEFL